MPDEHGKPTVFEQGLESGRVSQILREHDTHFTKINGSIEKSAASLNDLADQIRGLREDARLRDERVAVAAETLATETERRREELAGTVNQQDRADAKAVNKFTRRERLAVAAGGFVVTVSLAVIGYVVGK